MEAVYIPHLTKAPEQTQVIQVQESLPDLETLTPIRGRIQVQHHGNYLEVLAQAEAIITLTCHRCLQQYNHRLALDTSEMIWLEESSEPDEGPLEREITVDELVETLPPQGYFHPSEWLYEQLCLAIPQRQLCDAQCAGIQTATQEGSVQLDYRWASLEALKRQLP